MLSSGWPPKHRQLFFQIFQEGSNAPDGTAMLRATGVTGNPAYTADTTHPRSGVPYEYQVIAHFDVRHGTGKSVSNPPRVRIYTFVKD